MTIFNIEKSFTEKAKRRWQKIFIAVDVHDVILEGKYNLNNDGAGYMPNAIKVLQQWSKREDISLILWTSSHIGPASKVLDNLEKHNVYFKTTFILFYSKESTRVRINKLRTQIKNLTQYIRKKK